MIQKIRRTYNSLAKARLLRMSIDYFRPQDCRVADITTGERTLAYLYAGAKHALEAERLIPCIGAGLATGIADNGQNDLVHMLGSFCFLYTGINTYAQSKNFFARAQRHAASAPNEPADIRPLGMNYVRDASKDLGKLAVLGCASTMIFIYGLTYMPTTVLTHIIDQRVSNVAPSDASTNAPTATTNNLSYDR